MMHGVVAKPKRRLQVVNRVKALEKREAIDKVEALSAESLNLVTDEVY